jgi:hypothetical protein
MCDRGSAYPRGGWGLWKYHSLSYQNRNWAASGDFLHWLAKMMLPATNDSGNRRARIAAIRSLGKREGEEPARSEARAQDCGLVPKR